MGPGVLLGDLLEDVNVALMQSEYDDATRTAQPAAAGERGG